MAPTTSRRCMSTSALRSSLRTGAGAGGGVAGATRSASERCAEAGVPLQFIGVTGGSTLTIEGARALDVAALVDADQHG